MKQQQMVALMTPRSRAREEAKMASAASSSNRRGSGYNLDLRSINTDADDAEPAPTPRGWLKRTLTPRMFGGGKDDSAPSVVWDYTCVELEVKVYRGRERLGMELNAYATQPPTLSCVLLSRRLC